MVTPRDEANLYGMLVKKEVALRKRNQGTLHAKGGKKRNEEKWTHTKYDGWIRFSGSLGGTLVTVIRSRKVEAEGDLLASFLGFLDRHFRNEIASINIQYDGEG
jgi:hypothetical protein